MELSKQLWEKYHSENSIMNLGNYDLFSIRDYMEISELLTTGKTVLYVGVGTGTALKQLHELGCIIHSLDIAENARSKAEPYSRFWLESEFENMPDDSFDVIIHHLVAQHLSNHQLERHVSNAIRCLKPTGILAMQYAYNIDDKKSPEELAVALQKMLGNDYVAYQTWKNRNVAILPGTAEEKSMPFYDSIKMNTVAGHKIELTDETVRKTIGKKNPMMAAMDMGAEIAKNMEQMAGRAGRSMSLDQKLKIGEISEEQYQRLKKA